MTSNDPMKSGLGEHTLSIWERSHSLDLVSQAAADDLIKDSKELWFTPSTPIDNVSEIRLQIPAMEKHFIALKDTRLVVKARILTKNQAGAWVAAEAGLDYSVCNMLSTAIWSKVNIKFNNVEVESCIDKSYPYRSYLESCLSFNDVQKSTYMKSAWGFIPDLPESCNASAKSSTASTKPNGYDSRMSMVKEGKSFTFHTPIFVDLFNQSRYLIPGVNIDISLTKSPEDFFVLSADTNAGKFKLDLQSVEVMVRTVETAEKVNLTYDQLLLKGKPLLYPRTHSALNFISIQKQQVCDVNNIYNGILPSTLLIGFVEDANLTGTISKNPFVFSSVNLKSISLKFNGAVILDKLMEFDDDDYERAYLKLIEDLALSSPANSIRLSKQEFKSNFFLLSLDTTGCRCSSYHYHIEAEKKGRLSASLVFSQPNDKNLQMMVYTITHKSMKISGLERRITLEYPDKGLEGTKL